ncbi:MurR/RpiR family transcriptional regulator [Alkalibacterium sp. MB6]|uniref:MurR/RpiR family transcriptional regulator n=1 Tax=Alkalibacterium sp. MB6 TaxID=2081965 RepID=UPI00137A6A3C|nr:MurR/RpiR family transcriptional regulator [Alkalibacterium sp. MB6]
MINQYLKNLFKPYISEYSKTEKVIAQYFLSLGPKLPLKTLEELSEEISVSKTSIFKFVKKHGFDGFQDFKITLAQNNYSQSDRSNDLVVFSDISTSDSTFTIAQKVIQSSQASLNNLLQSLTEEQLNQVIDMIQHSQFLHFFGLGSSTTIAYDSYHKFIRSKYRCNYIQDHHMQISYATKLNEQDCVFLFSHSGKSIETINLAKVLKENNVNIILLTGNALSTLLEYADSSFIVDSEEASLGSESLSSRNLYLTIMDIIYTAIMYQDEDYNKESIANIRKALLHSKLDTQ